MFLIVFQYFSTCVLFKGKAMKPVKDIFTACVLCCLGSSTTVTRSEIKHCYSKQFDDVCKKKTRGDGL